MPRVQRIIAGVAVSAMAGAALTACGSGSGSSVSADCTPRHSGITTVAKGGLTAGVTDIPPFSTNETGGSAKGVDIDIVKAIADKECLKPVFQAATYASSIPLISQQRTLDLTTGDWYPTAERLKVVDFAGPIYTDSMGIVSTSGAKTVAELEQLGSVGTCDGYLWTEDLKAVLGDKLKTYPSSVELQQDVLSGRLDAGVDS